MRKKKNKREEFVDDGHVIANMNIEGMPGYIKDRDKYRDQKRRVEQMNLTRKEKWSIIIAAYSVVIPFALIIFGVLALAMLLMQYFWA